MIRRLLRFLRGITARVRGMRAPRRLERLLAAEKDDLREQLVHYSQGLASHATLCERLMGQVRRLEREELDLRQKAAAYLRAGARSSAAQLALRLETVSRELEEDRAQLEQAQAIYRDFLAARETCVRSAQQKIAILQAGLDDLKLKQTTAALNEDAAGLVASLGQTRDTLERLQAMVDAEREAAAERVGETRRSIDWSAVDLAEAEQRLLAERALEGFAAREGLELAASPEGSAEARERSRGSEG